MAIEEDPPAGIPEWVVTFGDMMSLLLTFFIMLVSMSEIKEDEIYDAVTESLRQKFGHELSRLNVVPGDSLPQNSNMQVNNTMGRAQRLDIMQGGNKVKAPTGDEPLVQSVRPKKDPNIAAVVFFEEGSSELTQATLEELAAFARLYVGKPQKIEVRGHTSRKPVPPNSPYKDNWDLAYDRCRAVMDQLIALNIHPERLRLSNAGMHEAIYTGTNPLELRKNSRVELYPLDVFVEDLQGSNTAN